MREGGPWQSTVGRDLAGSTFGVIGLGKIGTRVAKVARAFDMDVMAWSRVECRHTPDSSSQSAAPISVVHGKSCECVSAL